MNKTRLENITDGVFAIVMTLLAIEIRAPESQEHILAELVHLAPLFAAYFLTFVVLCVFWISHHAFFNFFVRGINRQLMLMNIAYLAFLSLIPFSSHFLGLHPWERTSLVVYGANILAVGLTALVMVSYVVRTPELFNQELPKRARKQGIIRVALTPVFALLGILAAFVWAPAALVLFAFPILFNIVPGSLDFTERVLRVNLDS